MKLTLQDVNKENLWTLILKGRLPIPKSVIPPERPYYVWRNLPKPLPYDASQDHKSKFIDEMSKAVERTLHEWQPIKRVGIWLSGGIDTSVLLSLTAEIVGANKVRAYTLTFGEVNESEYAKEIADYCDVKLKIKEMTPEDSIDITEEAVLAQRSPICNNAPLFISKLCKHDGTTRILSGLGLDELQGGYVAHVDAVSEMEKFESESRLWNYPPNIPNPTFSDVETRLLQECQSAYVWVQITQSQNYLEVKFPFLDSQFVSYCRGLPFNQKCVGRETKIRLREELRDLSLIPDKNIEAGRIAGTKGGFGPSLRDWFERGYDEWCNQNIPPENFCFMDRIKSYAYRFRRNRWIKLRLATTNTFLNLVENGEFMA